MKIKIIGTLLFYFYLISCSNEPVERKGGSPKEINRNGVAISYTVSGRGDTTLLFVHGAFIDQTYWREQVDYFNSRYVVVTMDLAGHGKSGKNRDKWTIQGFADDVATVIDELNLKNVILIGHSMAGDINLTTAYQRTSPIIGFIGIDNFKNAASPFPEKYKPMMDSVQKKLHLDFTNAIEGYVKMALVTPQTSEDVTNRVVQDFKKAYPPMALELLTDFYDTYKLERELLPKFRYKLYLINADYFPTNEELLKKYTGSGYEVVHLKGTSHYPMIEIPQLLNEALEKVIHKIEGKI